jgi:hypothetical protein
MSELLNHLVLISCICLIIGSILNFFYWNRFVAAILGFFIRLFYWNQEGSSVWIEIGEWTGYSVGLNVLISFAGAIQFSILTGRILLKDFHYHSSNQTIKIVKGEVVWRYWLWRTTEAHEIGHTVVEDRTHIS